MKFCFFHLMPYLRPDARIGDDTARGEEWPMPNKGFDPQLAQSLYREYIDTMVFSEQCGFDWMGANEHHFSPYGLMANCNLVGAALAYPTKTAKIAMMGNLVPLLNPVRVAEEYAMLDVMSGGRLIAGLMRGIPHEYVAYNIPPADSWSRQKEATQLIIRAWTEPEPFGWEGEHFQFRQVSIWPRPLQKPHPPLIMSASTPESAQFAAEVRASMGMVLIASLEDAKHCIQVYKDAARAAGWAPTRENVLIGQHMCVAETDEEAMRWMREGLEYFNTVLQGGPRTAQKIVLQKTRYYADDASRDLWAQRQQKRKGATLEDMIERGAVLCGRPKTVIRQMKRVAGELDNGVFNILMKVGNIPDGVVRRGMELFRDQVLPEVRDL